MSSKVLTLKYRPKTFAELIAQDHVKRTLTKAIEYRRFANAYLFAGPRGVGKTTTARILAKSLNCLASDKPTATSCNKCSACVEIAGSRSLDVLEIDGASNRGIAQVRELRENIKYAPMGLRYKVYIIDEVHMLTPQAFNALLKTLEEPPAHAKFIFATTAAHDVPATIVSRCQRFDFRKATDAEVAGRLVWLAGQEKIAITEPALLAIARRADGAIRDGESILEQLATYQPEGIELADVEELLGLVPSDLIFDFAGRLIAGDAARAFADVARVVEQGHDLLEFYSAVVRHFRNLLLIKTERDADRTDLTQDEKTRLAAQAGLADATGLVKALDTLLQSEQAMKHSQMLRFSMEGLAMNLIEVLARQKIHDPGLKPDNVSRATKEDSPEPTTRDDQQAPSHHAAAALPSEDVWHSFVMRVKGRKPRLGQFLESCSVALSDGDTLMIVCPPDKPEAHKALDADREMLERILGSITRRYAGISVKQAEHRPAASESHASRPGPGKRRKDTEPAQTGEPSLGADTSDPDLARITGVLGDVERVPKRR